MAMLMELPRAECVRLLSVTRFGRVGVSLGNAPPLIRPVNYIFDEASQTVVFRTAVGSKFHALVRSADAVFEIDGIDEATRTGWSVIIRGMTREVTDPLQTRRLDGLGLQPWASGDKPHWIEIRAWTVTGRRLELTDEQ
jgi:uncharacterized protein